jgi:hypothetical protein
MHGLDAEKSFCFWGHSEKQDGNTWKYLGYRSFYNGDPNVIMSRVLNDLIYRGPSFFAGYDSVPRPPRSPPLSRQQLVSLYQSSCVSPVYLPEGREWRGRGRGQAWSRIILPQESLAIYKSFIIFASAFIYLSWMWKSAKYSLFEESQKMDL